MGILRKTPYRRWATDNIWAYTINFERLKQELAPAINISTNEFQTALSRKSDSRESEIVQPTVENQTAYISLTLNSTQQQTEHDLPAAEEIVEEKESLIPKQAIAAKPTSVELEHACSTISRLSSQVQTNSQVKAAIENYWANFPAALERLKIAVQENRRCNLTGLLVKALKEGVLSEEVVPPCAFFGWKEWADEAMKRRLMQYSHSQNGDIMVHFVGGGQMLWSQLRGLSWAEVERIAKGEAL